MDALSQAIAFFRPRSYLSAGLHAGGAWGIDFPHHIGIKFNAIRRGACWLGVEGRAEVHRLEEGDCFLLTSGRPFFLASSPAAERVASPAIYEKAVDGIATCNGGGDFSLIGGRIEFDTGNDHFLFGSMPPVVIAKNGCDQAPVLSWVLTHLSDEVRSGRAGQELVTQHLSQIMLIQILRSFIDDHHGRLTGWLSAVSDRQLGPTLSAIHADPARRWTVADLADVAGMSRSNFADRFKSCLSISPIEYLTHCRMRSAADRLANSNETVTTIALSLGYDSESSFSTAFKRTTQHSPRAFRKLRGRGEVDASLPGPS